MSNDLWNDDLCMFMRDEKSIDEMLQSTIIKKEKEDVSIELQSSYTGEKPKNINLADDLPEIKLCLYDETIDVETRLQYVFTLNLEEQMQLLYQCIHLYAQCPVSSIRNWVHMLVSQPNVPYIEKIRMVIDMEFEDILNVLLTEKEFWVMHTSLQIEALIYYVKWEKAIHMTSYMFLKQSAIPIMVLLSFVIQLLEVNQILGKQLCDCIYDEWEKNKSSYSAHLVTECLRYHFDEHIGEMMWNETLSDARGNIGDIILLNTDIENPLRQMVLNDWFKDLSSANVNTHHQNAHLLSQTSVYEIFENIVDAITFKSSYNLKDKQASVAEHLLKLCVEEEESIMSHVLETITGHNVRVFTNSNKTLWDCFYIVYCLCNHEDSESRFLELKKELIDMSGTCMTGYVNRLATFATMFIEHKLTWCYQDMLRIQFNNEFIQCFRDDDTLNEKDLVYILEKIQPICVKLFEQYVPHYLNINEFDDIVKAIIINKTDILKEYDLQYGKRITIGT